MRQHPTQRAYDKAMAECRRLGNSDLKRAINAGERAVKLGAKLGPAEEGSMLAHLAYLVVRTNEGDKADAMIRRAIALIAPLGDPNKLGKIYGTYAAIQNNLGRPLRALKAYIRALQMINEDTRSHASVLDGLGYTLQQLGRPMEAIHYLLGSIEIYESQTDDVRLSASSYGAVASIYIDLGDLRRARRYLKQAEAAALATRDMPNLAAAWLAWGIVEMRSGKNGLAEGHFKKAEARAKKYGVTRMLSEAMLLRAELALRCARYEQAVALATDAARSIPDGDTMLKRSAASQLAAIHVARGEFAEAISCYREALGTIKGMTSTAFELTTRLAECYAALGQASVAYRLLTRGAERLEQTQRRQLSRSILIEKELFKLRRGTKKVRALQREIEAHKTSLATAHQEIKRLRRIAIENKRPPQVDASIRRTRPSIAQQNDLTLMERRICELLQFALPTKEIAGLLSISPRTVEWHRATIRKKLGLARSESLSLALMQR